MLGGVEIQIENGSERACQNEQPRTGRREHHKENRFAKQFGTMKDEFDGFGQMRIGAARHFIGVQKLTDACGCVVVASRHR